MNNKIRIGYLMPQLTVGGSERYLYDLIANLDKRYFDCVVICTGPWGPVGDELVAAGVEVRRMVFRHPLFHPIKFFGALSNLKALKCDIFQSYEMGPHYADAVVAKMAGIPIYISNKENTREWEGGNRLHFRERIRNMLSSLILANSQASKHASVTIEKISEDRITVIYKGVDFSRIPKISKKDQLKKELGISKDELVLGSLSNLIPRKRHGFLIEIFAELILEFPRLKLLIVGTGSEKNNLVDIAKRLNVIDRVIITELRWDRFDLMDAFDVFIHTAFAEGFGIVLTEAMAMSKPVVAMRVGGIPEIVVDGQTGFLCNEKKDFIEKTRLLILDEKLRIEMGSRGKERAREYFNIAKQAKVYEKLYLKLINDRKAA